MYQFLFLPLCSDSFSRFSSEPCYQTYTPHGSSHHYNVFRGGSGCKGTKKIMVFRGNGLLSFPIQLTCLQGRHSKNKNLRATRKYSQVLLAAQHKCIMTVGGEKRRREDSWHVRNDNIFLPVFCVTNSHQVLHYGRSESSNQHIFFFFCGIWYLPGRCLFRSGLTWVELYRCLGGLGLEVMGEVTEEVKCVLEDEGDDIYRPFMSSIVSSILSGDLHDFNHLLWPS